jgi:hypothetical protein
MKSSMSCAWTGSLVTLGGLGCVIWVFLRSLWMHIRVFWDKDPGRKFKWGSIVFGTMVPLMFLIAILAATGFSYRMGQTCLPNHEHATVTFWTWLVIFALLAFLLQIITTGYCFFVYMRTLYRAQRASAVNVDQNRQGQARADTWSKVKRLFRHQWRNILVSIFVNIGSISFFVVFATHDAKLKRVFKDPKRLEPVETWIICHTKSMGTGEDCREYVKDFTVDQAAMLTSLLLASASLPARFQEPRMLTSRKLVGIEIFILLFRISMLSAWISLFRRSTHFFHTSRPATPQLTSLETPATRQSSSPRKRVSLFSSTFSAETFSKAGSSTNALRHSVGADSAISIKASANTSGNTSAIGVLAHCPPYERVTGETGLLTLPIAQRFNSFLETENSVVLSATTSHSNTSVPGNSKNGQSDLFPPYSTSHGSSFQSSSRPLPQPGSSFDSDYPRYYTTMRDAPPPPGLPSSSNIAATKYVPTQSSTDLSTESPRDHPLSKFGLAHNVQKFKASKVKSNIAAPLPASFVHVDGAFLNCGETTNITDGVGVKRSGSQKSRISGLRMHPVEDSDLERGVGADWI